MDMGGTSLNNGGAYFKVNNGTSAGDDLWGLEWTPTTANEITSKWNVTFDLGGSTAYFDHVQVRITYSAGGGKIILTKGRLTIKSGKVTL